MRKFFCKGIIMIIKCQRFPTTRALMQVINNKLSDYAPISGILTCLMVLNNCNSSI